MGMQNHDWIERKIKGAC